MTDNMPTVPAVPAVVRSKSPELGVLVSFLVPGLGSIITGAGWGPVILVLWLFSWPLILVGGLGFLTGLACWVWGMVDAYKAARQWNTRHGVIS